MSLERIEITPFAVIVGDILQARPTGNLTIIRPPVRKVLYWSQGELVLITSAAPKIRSASSSCGAARSPRPRVCRC